MQNYPPVPIALTFHSSRERISLIVARGRAADLVYTYTLAYLDNDRRIGRKTAEWNTGQRKTEWPTRPSLQRPEPPEDCLRLRRDSSVHSFSIFLFIFSFPSSVFSGLACTNRTTQEIEKLQRSKILLRGFRLIRSHQLAFNSRFVVHMRSSTSLKSWNRS